MACVLVTDAEGVVQRQVRSFGTMTADLLALSDWLSEYGVTQIALESTGVYWRPVFNILEDEARTITLVHGRGKGYWVGCASACDTPAQPACQMAD